MKYRIINALAFYLNQTTDSSVKEIFSELTFRNLDVHIFVANSEMYIHIMMILFIRNLVSLMKFFMKT